MDDVRRMIEDFLDSIRKVVVGNAETIERVTEVFITGGHVLDEDEPGVGKTLMMESFAKASGLDYSWIQGTPDLRPSDITGGVVLDRETNRWDFRPGPLFANVVVMDEGNRIPPKTQAAALEAMQNRRVTVDGVHHLLPSPHMVLLTQNTRNSADVYELPEAMMDRFPIRLAMQELSVEEEALVYRRTEVEAPQAKPVNGFDINRIRKEYERIHVDPRFHGYVSALMNAARKPEDHGLASDWNQGSYKLGRSTRPGEWLIRLAKAGALLEGKRYITANLIQERLFYVLNHRLKNNFKLGINDAAGLDWVRHEYIPALLGVVPVPGVDEDDLEEAADARNN